MSFKNILVKIEGHFAVLTIDRPKALNALNRETVGELLEAFRELGQNRELRGVVVTGAGDKAFIAGADITEFSALDPLAAQQMAAMGQSLTQRLSDLNVPVIAAVNGYCLGGGFELALSADFIVASSNAVFGLPEVSLGLMPGWGGTQRLARLIGPNRARQMIYTGAKLKATEAKEWGIVNVVCEPSELFSRSQAILEEISKNSPIGVRQAKKALNEGLQVDLDRGLLLEQGYFAACFATQDLKEGVSAFTEKRKAKWLGK